MVTVRVLWWGDGWVVLNMLFLRVKGCPLVVLTNTYHLRMSVYTPVSGTLKVKIYVVSYLFILLISFLLYLLVLTFASIHWADTLSDMWVFVQLTSTKSITRQWLTNMDFSVTEANNWIVIDYTQLQQEKLCEHLRFAENVGMWCGFTIHFCINWI